jgi:hypothetical protein
MGPFWDVLMQTKTCVAMLRYARRPRLIRTLWVDAICINQLDAPEKATQILISIIYSEALRVVAFLGENTVDTLSG